MLGMGMSMSVGCYVRQEQKLAQMVKLSLRQELKIVLKLIIAMIQALKIGQKISVKQIQEIKQAVAELTRSDVGDLAYEMIRQGGIERACQLGYALHSVAKFDPDNFLGLAIFAGATIEEVRKEQDRRDHKYWSHCGPKITMALRLILREPKFLGGRDGTPESLADLLRSVPQANDRMQVEWVLAGGWAVEMLTGKHLREHHDIDAVLMTSKTLHLDSDEQHSDDYFGIISSTRSFLRQNCLREVQWQYGEEKLDVAVLCTEYLFLSKFLREPRGKDWDDVVELVSQFAGTWDLALIKKLIKHNCCGFNRTRELMQILKLRTPAKVLDYLSRFWGEKEPQSTMNATNQRTVRELKDQVLRELRCESHFDLTMANDPRPGDFWEKLNQLGSQRKTRKPEECDDIDATAFVSDKEYEELMVKARALPWFQRGRLK